MSAHDAERPWLAWSDGRYPEDTPGDVIAAWPDGTIMLDGSLTIWNPLRALAFVAAGGVLQGADNSRKPSRAERNAFGSAHGWAALREDIERTLIEARREKAECEKMGARYGYTTATGAIAALVKLLRADDGRKEAPPNDKLSHGGDNEQ